MTLFKTNASAFFSTAILALLTCGGTHASDWPSYNNTVDGARFSPLTQINRDNLQDLRESCSVLLGDDGPYQTGPILINGIIYVSTGHTTVAIGASNCQVIWRQVHPATGKELLPVSRGLAFYEGLVFRGTTDGHLIAMDARTGKIIWQQLIADNAVGEFLSAAPIAANGKVYIGPAGSDWGVKGRMSAFDVRDGHEVWRFNLVPQGHEPGIETWRPQSAAAHGGGGTWGSYTLDPLTQELFIPVGNAAPDYNPDARLGDNLYTDSLVVLDARTGQLKWFYQLNANDGFDYDMSAPPVLYTDSLGHKRVGFAGKNGYAYSIDRATHAVQFKTPVTTILNAQARPTPAGVHVCPGTMGGTEWNGPAYSPRVQALFVGSVDYCATFIAGETPYDAGKPYNGTRVQNASTDPKTGWIYALQADTGTVLWKYATEQPVVAALTPTAAGLVFAGDTGGHFLIFDDLNGHVLLKQQMSGSLAGGIITYEANGAQWVALAVGNRSIAFQSSQAGPALVLMRTGLPAHYVAPQIRAEEVKPL
jgi:alcohol dehydrogenase (cytochrome c)